MSRSSASRVARRADLRLATAEVRRVREAAAEHAEALRVLLVRVAELPQPAGATVAEHEEFRLELLALAADAGDLARLIFETIDQHVRRSMS